MYVNCAIGSFVKTMRAAVLQYDVQQPDLFCVFLKYKKINEISKRSIASVICDFMAKI